MVAGAGAPGDLDGDRLLELPASYAYSSAVGSGAGPGRARSKEGLPCRRREERHPCRRCERADARRSSPSAVAASSLGRCKDGVPGRSGASSPGHNDGGDALVEDGDTTTAVAHWWSPPCLVALARGTKKAQRWCRWLGFFFIFYIFLCRAYFWVTHDKDSVTPSPANNCQPLFFVVRHILHTTKSYAARYLSLRRTAKDFAGQKCVVRPLPCARAKSARQRSCRAGSGLCHPSLAHGKGRVSGSGTSVLSLACRSRRRAGPPQRGPPPLPKPPMELRHAASSSYDSAMWQDGGDTRAPQRPALLLLAQPRAPPPTPALPPPPIFSATASRLECHRRRRFDP
jgi:hypothetical protein